MSATRRLALPSAALVALGLLSAVLPGRAQQAPSGRFAFADTTLLRDTLDLRFDRLFELADSLRLTPDTLRALSIRWGFMPWRLVELADSMRVPVDSVGAVIERERYNPLSARAERVTEFAYTTGYDVTRTRKTWNNKLDNRLVRGPLFFSQTTTIQFIRNQNGRITNLQERRDATNEFGYRFGEGTSIGARAVLNRFDSDDPATLRKTNDRTSQYQLSLRNRFEPRAGISGELNAFTGLVDQSLTRFTKRGVDGEVNGRLVIERGQWLQNDWSGKITGNFARTKPMLAVEELSTRDLGRDLRGTVQLWAASPVSVNTDLAYRNFTQQIPDDSGFVSETRNANTDLSGGVRWRIDGDRSLSLLGGVNRSEATLSSTGGRTSGTGANLQLEARARLLGAAVESRFRLGKNRSESPALTDSGGYAGRDEDRSLEAVVTRQLMRQRLNLSFTGRLSLQRARYEVIGRYPSLPVPRDAANQSYRIEGRYTFSREFNTGTLLDVSRQEVVNLVSSSVATNSLTRTYRATWTWTYRAFESLTMTQNNSMLANYVAYPFNQPADRLLLEYSTVTTLNAVLTPRLSMDLTHLARVQPSGGYTVEESDGISYFRPADETQTYSLTQRTTYRPWSTFTVTFEPTYRWSSREGTTGGVSQPVSLSKSLTFGGTASLIQPIGSRGRLSANVGRSYVGERGLGYRAGAAVTDTRNGYDNWTAKFDFTWTL